MKLIVFLKLGETLPKQFSRAAAVTVATASLCLMSQASQAASLVGDRAALQGVSELEVEGTSWNVAFQVESFDDIYGSDSPAFLNYSSQASAAANALITFLNSVDFGDEDDDKIQDSTYRSWRVPFSASSDSSNSTVSSVSAFYDGTISNWNLNSSAVLGQRSAPETYAVFSASSTSNTLLPAQAGQAQAGQAQAVPTPALLPGLVGFGMSLARRRKQKATVS